MTIKTSNLLFISIFAMILLIPATHAQDYYADIDITIHENGAVDIEGLTNHPLLKDIRSTHNYTSKNKEIWTLNITMDSHFSDYLIDLHLPEGASLKYLKSPNVLSISEESGHIIVIVTGKNEPLYIIAQYTLPKETENTSHIYPIILVLIVAIILMALLKTKKQKPRQGTHNPENEEAKPFIQKNISARQKAIIEHLQKNNNQMTQKQLENSLKIPKSSLSRNLDSLEKKEIITKENHGMSNIIRLNSIKTDSKNEKN